MISPEVMQELLSVRKVLHYLPATPSTEKGWTPHEQQLFWVALNTYPQGPWTAIAEYIGTKTTRQAMTHAQKLRQKLKRWNKRLRRNPTVSSLMDGVTVTADSDVAVSANVAVGASMPSATTTASVMPCGMPPTASSLHMPPLTSHAGERLMVDGVRIVSDTATELESKDHEQHDMTYMEIDGAVAGSSTNTGAPRYALTSSPADQAQHAQYHYPATAVALPPRYPMPITFGPRPFLPAPGMDHAMFFAAAPHAGGDEAQAIPHDLVDDLARSLWEEDVDDDEITEEELKELTMETSRTNKPQANCARL
ncbi:hypothetical protein BBJ28_00007563 [Nothophytophthora sp. Chile5]|nr:hypothetical protein BBJ28_00007563 [Nothophytophthora sp. Chile5]